jgi:chromosome partitioning protein
MRAWAFVSQKGGVGKSTLCTELAVLATQLGEKVIILDLDPQGSSYDWRQRRGGEVSPPVARAVPERLVNAMEAAAELDAFTLALIDTAPHSDRGSLEAVTEASLVICPTRPSRLDLSAMRNTANLLDVSEAKGKAIAVINAVPSAGSKKVFADATELVKGIGFTVAKNYVVDRVAYVRATDAGKAVTEMKPADSKAVKELNDLWNELILAEQALKRVKEAANDQH